MSKQIKKVAVIGSGVMGSQIAAHIANAGLPVVLLDIVIPENEDRNFLSKSALEKMRKAEPSPFMHPDNARLVDVGNLEDHLEKLSDADWIVEAIVENPKIKSDLFKKIDAVRKSGSIISSNTSTIPVSILIDGQSEQFAKDFLIAHFFNPPRYMRLLELVTSPKTDNDNANIIRDFCDRELGKGVVPCHDTPGFIANRLGIFMLQCAVNAAYEFGLTVEEADAVFSKPTGMPKTGIFGLIDLIGLDLMPLISKSFLSTLPEDDAYRNLMVPHPVIDKMIADGYTGRKGKGGFYRVKKVEGGKVFESVDLNSGEYRPTKKSIPDTVKDAGGNLRAMCDTPDNIGKFAWSVLSQTLCYAASLVPQIADDIVAVDAGMKLGFNWKYGPFELMDRLGADWMVTRLESENRTVPDLLRKAVGRSFYKVQDGSAEYLSVDGEYQCAIRPQGVLLLEDVKRASKPVTKNNSASVWDVGDGVLCFEIHTKMNSIDEDVLALIKKSVSLIHQSGGKYKGLVIYSDSDVFSVGANLGLALFCINVSMYSVLGDLIRKGHEAFHALRFARFPSVAATSGLALGGGCELALHCSSIQSHAETNMGLVETGVGLIPCWGGCTQMLGRAFAKKDRIGGPIPPVTQVFDIIRNAKKSSSAFEARDLLFLREGDGITMNRDRLLYDAKQKVLSLSKHYKPPEQFKLSLPGSAGKTAIGLIIEGLRVLGKALPHDVVVAKSLAAVLCGGEKDMTSPINEEQLMDLEHREFMKLQRTQGTAARIGYMLKNGKPLRN